MTTNTSTQSFKSTTIPALPLTANPQPNDLLIIEHTEPGANLSVTSKISLINLTSQSNLVQADAKVLSTKNLIIRNSNTTPANSTSTSILEGTIWWDTNFLYVSTANNIVKRTALSAF